MDLTTEEGVQAHISSTLKPCGKADRLSEGFSSFVYRAELEEPLEDGSTSVILKHVQGYAARSKQFTLDAERLSFEHAFLTLISPHLPTTLTTAPTFPLTIPQAYSYSASTHALTLRDFGPSPSLKAYLIDPPATLTQTAATALGTQLALFLSTIHNLSITDPSTMTSFAANTSARALSAKVYYGNLPSRAAAFGHNPPWLADLAQREVDLVLGKTTAADGDEVSEEAEVLTAGDFWPGNVLVTAEGRLVPLDFELAKPGMAAFDVGQMAAELFMVHWFVYGARRPGDGPGPIWNPALRVLRAFLEKYQANAAKKVDAARVAVRVGAHLVVIGPMAWPGPEHRDNVAKLVDLGIRLLQAGMENRREGWHGVLSDSLERE